MNEYEYLLAKAMVCLNEASKIEDTAVRAKVLELVSSAQQVAEAAILRNMEKSAPSP